MQCCALAENHFTRDDSVIAGRSLSEDRSGCPPLALYYSTGSCASTNPVVSGVPKLYCDLTCGNDMCIKSKLFIGMQ